MFSCAGGGVAAVSVGFAKATVIFGSGLVLRKFGKFNISALNNNSRDRAILSMNFASVHQDIRISTFPSHSPFSLLSLLV